MNAAALFHSGLFTVSVRLPTWQGAIKMQGQWKLARRRSLPKEGKLSYLTESSLADKYVTFVVFVIEPSSSWSLTIGKPKKGTNVAKQCVTRFHMV